MTGKLLILPDRKRVTSQADTQRRYLETHEIPVQQKWSWPQSTWMSRRLELIRNGQNKR